MMCRAPTHDQGYEDELGGTQIRTASHYLKASRSGLLLLSEARPWS